MIVCVVVLLTLCNTKTIGNQKNIYEAYPLYVICTHLIEASKTQLHGLGLTKVVLFCFFPVYHFAPSKPM